jgi:hypothetical protein
MPGVSGVLVGLIYDAQAFGGESRRQLLGDDIAPYR